MMDNINPEIDNQPNQKILNESKSQNSDQDPNIDNNAINTDKLEEYISPFKLPTDEEVFLFRENEKKKKMELKAKASTTKIWDKKTASSKHPLNHYKKFELNVKYEPEKQRKGYSQREKTLISSALEVVKDRAKEKDQIPKKEGVIELVEQKKEMFLVTMAHGILENEIERLKKINLEKDQALEQSRKMLKQDQEDFYRHMENNKMMTEAAQHKENQESKEKRIKEAEIKVLTIRLNTLKAEKARNDESTIAFKEHKEFLDKLASKEWQEQKQLKRNIVIEKAKEAFIQREMSNVEEYDESDIASTVPGAHIPSKQTKDKKIVKSKSVSSIRSFLEEKFYRLLTLGEIDEVEEFDDEYGMFFNHPQQLLEYFSTLEEKNIFLIQTTQDTEQNFEELKAEFKKKREDLESKAHNLQETKNQKLKMLQELNKSIAVLQDQKDDHSNSKAKDEMLGPIRKKLIELFKEEVSTQSWSDIDNKSTMDILTIIEGVIRQYLKKIKEYKEIIPEKVEYFARLQRTSRKKDNNDNGGKNKLYGPKTLKTLKEKQVDHKKKTGRIIMKRSAPLDREVPKEDIVVNNEEEEEKKFFE